MKHLLIAFVRLWRALISPLYGDVCKYHPSCSRYGLEALQVHGALKGSWLTVWRILRCNPFSDGGYDPVPGTIEADRWKAEQASQVPDPRPAHSPTNWSVAVATGNPHNTRGEF